MVFREITSRRIMYVFLGYSCWKCNWGRAFPFPSVVLLHTLYNVHASSSSPTTRLYIVNSIFWPCNCIFVFVFCPIFCVFNYRMRLNFKAVYNMVQAWNLNCTNLQSVAFGDLTNYFSWQVDPGMYSKLECTRETTNPAFWGRLAFAILSFFLSDFSFFLPECHSLRIVTSTLLYRSFKSWTIWDTVSSLFWAWVSFGVGFGVSFRVNFGVNFLDRFRANFGDSFFSFVLRIFWILKFNFKLLL